MKKPMVLNSTMMNIEPLQVIRYNPGERYAPHPDAHTSAASTYAGEQREWTVLLYLSDVPDSDGGGGTHFQELGLRVLPRAGDAVMWHNLHDGMPNPLALHAGEAPEEVVKYALNIWQVDTAFDEEAARGLRRPSSSGSGRKFGEGPTAFG